MSASPVQRYSPLAWIGALLALTGSGLQEPEPLVGTGAIAGRVQDVAGEPIAGVRVSLSCCPGGPGRSGTSDERGLYRIPSVPSGKHVIEAVGERHLPALRGGLQVEDGVTTSGVVLRMRTAPKIMGSVVDEQGGPLAGVRLLARPVGGGRTAEARSKADGTFELFLRRDEACTLEAELDGFLPWEHVGDAGGLAPWTAGVRITMRRTRRTTFVALDALSGSPVIRFGLRIEPAGQREARRRHATDLELLAAAQDSPDGERTLEATPGAHRYRLLAPGYAPSEGLVRHDSPGDARMTVSLERGAGLRGRVLVGGRPAVGASVTLRDWSLVRMHASRAEPFDENAFFWSEDPFWLEPPFAQLETDREGRFSIELLAAGEYRLELDHRGARGVLDPLPLGVGEGRDLGDVALREPVLLRGRVRVPQGVPTAGLPLWAEAFAKAWTLETEADGSFEWPGLPAGVLRVGLKTNPGGDAGGPWLELRLEPGATHELELDARERSGCLVVLEVRVAGERARGVVAELVSVVDDEQAERLPPTDRTGGLARWVRPLDWIDLRLWAPSGMPMASRRAAARLSAGGEALLPLDVECGRLALRWPDLAPGEELEQVFLEGLGPGTTSNGHPSFVPARPEPDITATDSNACEFQWVAPGDYDWTIHVVPQGESAQHRVYRKRVTIRAGETTECTLTEADEDQQADRRSQRRPRTTLVVLDAVTGEPVTRFGVRLFPREGIEEWTPHVVRALQERPQGKLTLDARPLVHRYRLLAPGYAPAEGIVVHDAPGVPRTTVHLERSGIRRGGILRGRVLFRGQPVERASVTLRGNSLVRLYEEDAPGEPFDENDYYWNSVEGAWDPLFPSREVARLRTDHDGRFEIEIWKAGEHRLELYSNGARGIVDPLDLVVARTVDLGDIALVEPVLLRGRLLVPPGVSPGGLVLGADVFDQHSRVETEEDGRFEFPGLPAGVVHVTVEASPGRVAWGPEFEFRLEPGEAREVVFDVRDRRGCAVKLEVRVDGQPARDAYALLTSSEDPEERVILGRTDDRGVAERWSRAIGPVDLRLTAPSGMALAVLPAAADLSAGGDVNLSVDVECGRLSLRWPPLPEGEKPYHVSLRGALPGTEVASSPTFWTSRSGPDVAASGDNGCLFRWVPPGEYDWTIRVVALRGETTALVGAYRKHVTVRAGETTKCVLTEADRVKD